ncbi:hypothetical protein [Pedobacter chinensis]|uniref:hypothetical protein n=1 Tax=Pedobacter chinensis TaxID=2282421 RepID=UPI0013146742|nr:hypothetical protein [Pedobacter chinensis]
MKKNTRTIDGASQNTEIDEAARRLNQQTLWENTISGQYLEGESGNDAPEEGEGTEN